MSDDGEAVGRAGEGELQNGVGGGIPAGGAIVQGQVRAIGEGSHKPTNLQSAKSTSEQLNFD